MFDFLKNYGMKVPGYDVGMVNEREVRAGAGILFVIGFLVLNNAVMLGHSGIGPKFFVSYFAFDMLVRIINPFYAPSLILGRLFIRNQEPEYIAAKQKRLAWLIGFLIAIPMVFAFVITPYVSIAKIFVCLFCLSLLLMETSFGFCLGCFVYRKIFFVETVYCTGGCKFTFKEEIQKFNPAQIIILIVTILGLGYAAYYYLYDTKNLTNFGKHVSTMTKTDAQLKAIEDKLWQKQVQEFNSSDF